MGGYLVGRGSTKEGASTSNSAPCLLAINSRTIWYSTFFADYLLISFITFTSLGWSILKRWDVLQLPALLSQNSELPILWNYHIYSFIQTSGQILVSITYCLPHNSNAFSDWTRTCHVSKQCISQGRTKLTNSLGKLELELLTRTWSGRVPWNRGKSVWKFGNLDFW